MIFLFFASIYSTVVLMALGFLLFHHNKKGNNLKWFEAIFFVIITSLWPLFVGGFVIRKIQRKVNHE